MKLGAPVSPELYTEVYKSPGLPAASRCFPSPAWISEANTTKRQCPHTAGIRVDLHKMLCSLLLWSWRVCWVELSEAGYTVRTGYLLRKPIAAVPMGWGVYPNPGTHKDFFKPL